MHLFKQNTGKMDSLVKKTSSDTNILDICSELQDPGKQLKFETRPKGHIGFSVQK